MRPLALLALGSSLLACVAEGDELPECALEVPLFDLPELRTSLSAFECTPRGWLAEVEPLEAAWTVELGRTLVTPPPVLRWHPEGPLALIRDELIGLDPDGNERWRVDLALNTSIGAAQLQVGEDGRIYLADDFGPDSYKIVVRDGSSAQQLGQVIVEDAVQPFVPPIVLQGDALWIQRRLSGGGSELLRYTLELEGPTLAAFVASPLTELRDMVVTPGGRLVGLDGFTNILAGLELDTGEVKWTHDLGSEVSLSSRVLAVGEEVVVLGFDHASDPTAFLVTRYDAETGEQLWRRELGWSARASSPALLPDGRLAVVGGERHEADSSNPMPMIALLDPAGELLAGQRLAVEGAATGVAAGPAGELFVIGWATSPGVDEGQDELLLWLRRY